MEDCVTIGDRVRELRRRKALTQGQLAEAVGRDRSTISLIESNHNFPQPGTIQRIAGALDVPPEALTDPSWSTTVPKEPPPRSMGELLERAGVSDRTFTMSLVEIGEVFEGLSYQEAYTLAREIADVRAAVKPVLAQHKGTPEEVSLTVQSMEINMVANLSFQAIAERERSRAVEQGDAERAGQIEKEEQEVKLLEKRVA
jgi:transcriptional regulator with XRE-family HTH domain